MTRRALSVTLESDNVTWLRGRAGATGESVSALLDQIVTSARQGAYAGPARSVVGTIAIDSSDPLLERADTAIRASFSASLERPLIVREDRGPYRQTAKKPRERRG